MVMGMADIKRGESIFIPFRNGTSIYDSQCKPRMYKTIKAFERHYPGHYRGNYGVELVEYAEIIRCKDCKHYHSDTLSCDFTPHGKYYERPNWYEDDFCSYGEKRDEKVHTT